MQEEEMRKEVESLPTSPHPALSGLERELVLIGAEILYHTAKEYAEVIRNITYPEGEIFMEAVEDLARIRFVYNTIRKILKAEE